MHEHIPITEKSLISKKSLASHYGANLYFISNSLVGEGRNSMFPNFDRLFLLRIEVGM